jgi:hypothetical protein
VARHFASEWKGETVFASRISDSRQRRRIALSYQQGETDSEADAGEGPSEAELETAEIPTVGSQDTATLPTTNFEASDESQDSNGAECRLESESVLSPDWRIVANPLQTPRPAVCVFAGVRTERPNPFSPDLLPGEAFARCWRTATGRESDVVIDATRPGSSVAALWDDLEDRVLRFHPDVAFLLLGDDDARIGLEELPRFERRLEAIITGIQLSAGIPVFVLCGSAACESDFDRLVFQEAIQGVAKERDIAVISDMADVFGEGAERFAEELCRRLVSSTN